MKEMKKLMFIINASIFLISNMAVIAYATGDLEGTIKDTDGKAVYGAVVLAVLNNNVEDYSMTGTNGKYSILGLDAGTYKLDITRGGYEKRTIDNVAITNGDTTVVDVLNLAKEAKICGRITKEDSTTGIANAFVEAIENSGLFHGGVSDQSGNYTINQLPAGTYTIKCSLFDKVDGVEYIFAPKENNTVNEDQTLLNINFVGTPLSNGTISGKITKSDGSTPVEGADITAKDSCGEIKGFKRTSSTGEYEITNLDSGTYTVTVWYEEELFIANDNVSVTNDSTTTINFSLTEGAISGIVKNTNQIPLEGAIVKAFKESGEVYKTAITDSEGHYIVKYLPAGTYSLSIDPNQNNCVSAKKSDVTVTTNIETQNQNFTLEPDGKISGTVKNLSQQPIIGATIMVTQSNPEADYIPAETASDGSYTIKHLRSGTYEVIIIANGYVSDSETDVTVSQGQITSEINFTLGNSGGTISGTVYKEDDMTPIQGAIVSCYSYGKSWASTTTDNNGNYSLPLLQEGTYQVQAFKEGQDFEILEGVTVEIDEETSGINFTLDIQ